ncbi:MAG: hypothetical protein INH12_12830 [Cupriavidus sp.]|nr:hypothetical protein [Cupriavidus sp.]QWE96026.1 hypothetical protein KLP38_11060 [Cupriavidus sp. EM10]MCA3199309.1 hypothetical protein [Cupriavidus sp.]MCA3204576.1 hypothetical protein [Cupriavidus sp.]MCA3209055.1 hypothetical protein [Cupriavidus sp.]
MSHIRKDHLEHWIEFVNPYRRIRGAIDRLLSDLGELNLRPDASNLGDSGFLADQVKGDFEENLAQYSKALGLCFGIRSMLPVMVESFVNLMLFMFMRSDLRNDPRLRDNAIRQQIDIRIKTLHITCIGFKEPINYSSEICGKYHSLVNERNDLLHGNVSIDKLKFNEVYFDRRIPVFKEYRNAWDRSIGVEIGAVGLDMLHAEVEVAEGMIEYLISCVDDRLQANLRRIMETRDLGWNEKNNRLGILFPGTLVDMRAVFEDKKTDTPTEDIKEQAPE